MSVQAAMANVDTEEDMMKEERRRISHQPSIKVDLYVTSVDKMIRDAQAELVNIETDFSLRRDAIEARINADKEDLNRSIKELEKQLGDLRVRWSQVIDNGAAQLKRADEEHRRQIEAQERIIRSQRAMLNTLTGD